MSKPQDIPPNLRKILPEELEAILSKAPSLDLPLARTDLLDWALGRKAGTTDWAQGNRSDRGTFEVSFDVPGKGPVLEAEVLKARNGISVNFPDVAMRRRDPDAMVIADDLPTDKVRFAERFGTGFAPLRKEIFDWLSDQPLVVVPFFAGPSELGYGSLLVCPRNASFFAAMLADLQGFVPADRIPDGFDLRGGVVYVAPHVRHTAFGGRQVVVHNRLERYQEIFSTNLYPGPSAKKGIYSCLLHQGEKEGWTTNHCSAVQVETPYDNIVVFMHEGASGGGKSEMLEHVHREADGRLLLGTHVSTGEKRHFVLPTACKLYPMMDDMGAAHPSCNQGRTRLHVADAEDGWFIRTDNILHYGTDPHLEEMCLDSPQPLIYLNHFAQPGDLALIWEHAEDAPGKRCPNPRVIVPRGMMPDIRSGSVAVNVRSFGVRCPPATRESPSYGIMGLFHVIPPALAWLWRLTAPRGYANPSIQEVGGGMKSEGVGSFWPFCTGRKVDQANLLLEQFVSKPDTKNILIPNQHIGAWKVGFMPSWIAREYLARRGGARFRPDQLVDSRCALLGRVPWHMQIEGTLIPRWFLEVETQPDLGEEAFDKGAAMLEGFFHREASDFLRPDLDPLGRRIVQCCLDKGSVHDYESLIRD
jgi:hypothetical protein